MTTSEINESRPATGLPGGGLRRARGARLSLGRQTGVIAALLVVCVYLTATQPVFLTWSNVCNIVASNSVILVLAVGATFVIISGGFDLSAASVTTACGMGLGVALEHGAPFIVALLVPLALGLAIGLVNGILISWVKMSFLVVTLAAMSIYSSVSLVTNGGSTISVYGTRGFGLLYDFLNDRAGGIPYIMIFDVALVLIAGGVLRYTPFGRSLFAIGSNPEAARINGVNVTGVILAIYTLAGVSAGLGSLVQVGRLTGASPDVDSTQIMTVIAAVLIGGTAFSGGEGGVFGTTVGVFFLGVVADGLTLSQVSAFWQGCVNGGILLLAVAITTARDRGWITRWLRPALVTPIQRLCRCSGYHPRTSRNPVTRPHHSSAAEMARSGRRPLWASLFAAPGKSSYPLGEVFHAYQEGGRPRRGGTAGRCPGRVLKLVRLVVPVLHGHVGFVCRPGGGH
jgi:ribose transport system permease protein